MVTALFVFCFGCTLYVCLLSLAATKTLTVKNVFEVTYDLSIGMLNPINLTHLNNNIKALSTGNTYTALTSVF